ncbi:MAG: flippase-like domain-containing protein [Gemmatimonadota bacterium]
MSGSAEESVGTGTSGSGAAASGDSEPRMVRGLDRLFRTALVIIPIGVIGNVLFSLLVTDREVLASVRTFPREYLLLALALGAVPWICNSLRLLIWTRFLGHQMRFLDSFRITLATDLGAAVSPTAVGGGFFKWGLLVQRGVSPGAAVSLTTLAPLEDGLFFAIAIPIAIFLTASWGHPVFGAVAGQFQGRAAPALLVALGIAVATWAAVRWVLGGGLGNRAQRRSRRLVRRVRRGLRTTWIDARQVYRLIRANGKSRFALSMSLTSLQWIARYSIVSALIAFLGAPVQPVLFWLLQWVVFTLAAFIPTPGAAGGAEAAFFVIYSAFIPGSIIGLATAGWRFFTFYLNLALAALLYILLGGARRRRVRGG